MNPPSIAERLAKLGPQPEGLSPFMARFCFHQSWFRSEVLRVSCAEYGHLLQPEDGAKGLNFAQFHVNPFIKYASLEEQKQRYKTDVVNDLSSIETMIFNFFCDLYRYHSIVDSLFKFLFQTGYIYTALPAPEPYMPRRDYLADNTKFDTFIEYDYGTGRRDRGTAGVIFLRSDHQFVSHPTFHSMPKYQEITALPDSPWKLEALLETFDQPRYNSLWRQYMLLVATKQAEQHEIYLIGIYHPADEESLRLVKDFQSFLKPNTASFLPISINALIQYLDQAVEDQNWTDSSGIMIDGPSISEFLADPFLGDKSLKRERQTWQRWVKTLQQRYVDFSPSEPLWQAYQTRNQA